jgi:hypothetical protein
VGNQKKIKHKLKMMTDVIPPPSLEALRKLQLMRFTLVRLMDHRRFGEIVQDCYVRVLLEMRQQGRQNGDNYFIVQVKSVQRGPSYTGFSWDGHSTEWHLVIELPPTLRGSAANNNVVQMNSISNSSFRQAEYDEWLRAQREANMLIVTGPQLQLRYEILREHLDVVTGSNEAKRVASGNLSAAEAKLKEDAEREIREEYVLLPRAEEVGTRTYEDLLQVECQVAELIAQTRFAILERDRCFECRAKPRTVVCYPCKHQALCGDCMNKCKVCPVPTCNQHIASTIVPFTS